MLSQRFTRSLSDPCLYTRAAADGSMMYVTVWVDDLLISSSSLDDVNGFKQAISTEFKMKDLGPVHFCLGMRIRAGQGRVSMDQERYVLDLLERYKMADCRPVSTPLPPGTELIKAKESDPTALAKDEALRYREITGSLMYLVACTRPDLAVAVNQLTRNMANPTQAHMTAAKHVLRYLKGTAGLGLLYGGRGKGSGDNTVVGFADATWGSIPDSSRSVSGYLFMINGAAVSWKCRVQSCVALSTAEAEFFSLCDATREAVYLRNLMQELGFYLRPMLL